ncbi:PREDICTED: uncharacterized protein LOC109154735 [Ipomoea nil]|uniref:uncharacterized protein LOC109154735 n=1 Tax=Ipomoea nil TaxID=35883 RepID=UPI000901C55F|nr:PREDICTED: uncharacterized protein LOC109154735 [Ipomoea nil]
MAARSPPALSLIEDKWADLFLADEECGGLTAPDTQVVDEGTSQWELVGRFLTDRAIKFEHMKQVMASVWRPVMGMHVGLLDENLFLFHFPHPKDMQRVLDDGPWLYENNLLVCAQIKLGMRPDEVDLNNIPFWVQVHGLPAVYASQDFITKIGDHVGAFMSMDPNKFGGSWRSYFRIRIMLDVNLPLKRMMKLLRRDNTSQWITFRYERLNLFYFCCGILGHTKKFCKKIYEEGIEPEAFPFGAWMKAGPRRQVKLVGARWLLPSKSKVVVVATGDVSPSVALAVV